MKLQKENYEEWAVSYLEGNLEPSEVAIFMAFLVENPRYAEELEILQESPKIIDSKINKIDFNFLKKPYESGNLNSESFEDYCIAMHEGDLSQKAENTLNNYIRNNAHRSHVYACYEKLKICPDYSLQFPDKFALTHSIIIVKRNKIKRLFYSTASVAAILVFSFLVWNLKSTLHKPNNTFVQNDIAATMEAITPILSDLIEGTSDKAFSSNKTAKNIFSVTKQNNKKRLKNPAEQQSVSYTDRKDGYNLLSRIEPKAIHNSNLSQENTLHQSSYSYYNSNNSKRENQTINKLKTRGLNLITRAGNITLNNILQKSVEGLNQLAEADLEYKSEINEEGRIIEFALSSERFNIKHKKKNN